MLLMLNTWFQVPLLYLHVRVCKQTSFNNTNYTNSLEGICTMMQWELNWKVLVPDSFPGSLLIQTVYMSIILTNFLVNMIRILFTSIVSFQHCSPNQIVDVLRLKIIALDHRKPKLSLIIIIILTCTSLNLIWCIYTAMYMGQTSHISICWVVKGPIKRMGCLAHAN